MEDDVHDQLVKADLAYIEANEKFEKSLEELNYLND